MSRTQTTDQAERLGDSVQESRPIRVLHSVGHLLRGGIETWLYQMVKRLGSRFEHHVMVRTTDEENFTRQFQEAGVTVLSCVNYANPPKYAMNFARLVKENGPYDILHVHGSNPNGLQAAILAKPLGIRRTIVHSHNDLRPLLKGKNPLYQLYVGFTLKTLGFFADRGLAVSTLAAESMFGTSWRQDPKVKLFFCGVDFAPFLDSKAHGLRDELGIPAGAFVIGHVGRFHEQKNHTFIVEIAREVIRRNQAAYFLFVGDGELRSAIQAAFDRDNLAGHATFVPDTRSVPRHMAAMDCFLFPSRYEGLGLVAVEAQAAGLPCFISDRVPKEAIVDRRLVEVLTLEQSPSAWAESILQDRDHCPLSDVAARMKILNEGRFNLDRNAAALAALYRESLSAPS